MKSEDEASVKIGRSQAYFLSGRLWDKILLFSLPIALTNILQQLFNTADIAVVGRLAGSDALAAVGCTGPIIALFVSLFSGFSIGANAIISRQIGAGNEDEVRKSVHSSIAIALIIGLIITAIGEIIAKPLLYLVRTPEDVIDLAAKYLRIYFSGSVFIMLYNFEAAILRAGGDTKTPVFVLLASGIINIGLNLFFVLALHMSVDGVALATLISNIISACILFAVLKRYDGVLRVNPSEIRIIKGTTKSILIIGLPAAIQGMLFNIANVVIQWGVNVLGSDVVAGSTAGLNVEVFAYYAVSSLGQASITFNSQNFGAGNLKRCAESTRWCVILGTVITAIIALFMITFRKFLVGLFTPDKALIEIGSVRIVIIVSFEVFNMLIDVLSGSLRGMGYSTLPAILCIFFICGIRILWLLFVFPLHQTFTWLLAIYPISWIFAVISLTAAYFYVKRKLNSMAEI